MRLILVHNTEHASCAAGHWPGRDTELSPRGEEQSLKIAECLDDASVNSILSSHTRRGTDTVGALAAHHSERLNAECAFDLISIGEHMGLPYDESRALMGDDKCREMLTVPRPDTRYMSGGETLSEMAERAWQRVSQLVLDRSDAERSVTVSTHEEVIGAILCKMSDMPLSRLWWWAGRLEKPAYASITHVIYDEGRWTLENFGNTLHLVGL